MRSSVFLPAPFGPRIATVRPASMRSETPARAGLPAKSRARSVVTTAGGRESGDPRDRGDT